MHNSSILIMFDLVMCLYFLRLHFLSLNFLSDGHRTKKLNDKNRSMRLIKGYDVAIVGGG